MKSPLIAYSALPTKLLIPSQGIIFVPTCLHCFKPWQGVPISDTYGGKAVLDWNGEPLFAELAILRMVQSSGWQGVWIDTYRRKFRQHLPPAYCDLPLDAQDFLDRANKGEKWNSGCPDVFAWNDGEYLLIEAKRKGKDLVRNSQIHWLESALTTVPVESFLLFEWTVSVSS